MGSLMVRLLGLADGCPTPIDGHWLVEYDPRRPGVLPDGTPLSAHLVTSADVGRARLFASAAQLRAYVFADSGRLRPDGEPDRPLTAYTMLVEPGAATST